MNITYDGVNKSVAEHVVDIADRVVLIRAANSRGPGSWESHLGPLVTLDPIEDPLNPLQIGQVP